jgi:OOP family OmpA-OmpF porin
MTKASLTYFIRLALITVVAGSISPGLADAADKAGCRDIQGIKRFDGSSIKLCEQRSFAEYTLPTGQVTVYDYDKKKAQFERKENLEGRLTQNVYEVPAGPSSAEVFRNYKINLEAAGFTILFEAKQDETKNLEAVFENIGPGGQLFGYSPDEARYAAAVREQGGERTYLALYVIEYRDGYVPEFDAKMGQVYVRLDALQAGRLADRMVVVSSAEIAKDLDGSGKVVLHGILFDFNQASLRPESRPTIDEIGKLLKSDPARKVYVIGHTDNVGGFDFNMQLSQARASAVAADLIKTYGIAASRLRASGVGLQAPIASNADEDGRAKNRRVELLPQ